MSLVANSARRRVRVRIAGTVQGVGFRPYVYRLAKELGLSGYVLNDARGVLVEVEAETDAVEQFLVRLPAEAPPLAKIDRISTEPAAALRLPGFEIRASPRVDEPHTAITADSATCEDCLSELFDPDDRRFRYPFINCTNCGPRFTIVHGVPYDRPYTTMAGFRMCAACQAEYDDPGDRRFHAQPIACPVCGPSLTLVGGSDADATDPLGTAVGALAAGAIVGVKGLGGFHLACAAADEDAVTRLRSRKHREDKPFALMAATVESARSLVELAPEGEALLTARERPIVLAPRMPDAAVAAAVAPRTTELGVMLPYSPLHYLLLDGVRDPLVLTSGNVSDEPIAYRDADALERLAQVADLILLHDRAIATRTDDSVVRTIEVAGARRPQVVRRSRGYVPAPLHLPIDVGRPILACGAELKNTFCVAKREHAWVSHHIGDLENWETLSSFREGIDHFQELFAVRPAIVAHDLHPEYLSTKYAMDRDDVELVGVQHHHAHLAACLAEHGESGPAVGAIFDGTGLGTDGTIWGGELLYGDLSGFEREGSLWPVPMPGGAAAIREPWRMALAWLDAAGAGADEPPPLVDAEVSASAWRGVGSLIRSGSASPSTSSVGRLFDAVAALCGVRARITFEGQAAIELEAACDPAEQGAYPMPLVQRGRSLLLDARVTIRALQDDLRSGTRGGVAATRFHNGLADATVRACSVLARRRRVATVVLSGGTFLNRRLIERAAAGLASERLRVLTPERLPPGDGGISYGQVAVAAARLTARG